MIRAVRTEDSAPDDAARLGSILSHGRTPACLQHPPPPHASSVGSRLDHPVPLHAVVHRHKSVRL
jgi:hypothetical protein